MPVHQQGLQALLETYFTGEQSPPEHFYVGLAQDASLAKTDTLADINEVSGSGYARIEVDPVTVLSAEATNDNWAVVFEKVTFQATGTWTSARIWFLATSNDSSGKLIASNLLEDGAQTLENGSSIDVTPEIHQNG